MSWAISHISSSPLSPLSLLHIKCGLLCCPMSWHECGHLMNHVPYRLCLHVEEDACEWPWLWSVATGQLIQKDICHLHCNDQQMCYQENFLPFQTVGLALPMFSFDNLSAIWTPKFGHWYQIWPLFSMGYWLLKPRMCLANFFLSFVGQMSSHQH